jgi:hypothetical protein
MRIYSVIAPGTQRVFSSLNLLSLSGKVFPASVSLPSLSRFALMCSKMEGRLCQGSSSSFRCFPLLEKNDNKPIVTMIMGAAKYCSSSLAFVLYILWQFTSISISGRTSQNHMQSSEMSCGLSLTFCLFRFYARDPCSLGH